jgi:predicted  nucleic acid-binding Zn-ribbon protein
LSRSQRWFYVPADLLAEKELIRDQFAELMRQKTEVDEAQKPLLIEIEDLRKRINQFAEQQSAITVIDIPLGSYILC